jgi:hypothetical protein
VGTVKGIGSVDRDRQLRLAGDVRRHRALVLDANGQRQFLVDDREGGGVLDDEPPVPVILLPGQQQVQRRRQVRHTLDVVDLPVGDHHRPGDAGARLLGHQLGQGRGGERAGVVLGRPHAGLAKLCVGQRLHRLADAGGSPIRLVRPARDLLTGGAIHHHQHDVGKGCPILLLVGRVGHGDEQRQRREPAQPPPAEPAPERERHEERREGRERVKRRKRQERIEQDLAGAVHQLAPFTARGAREARARAPGRICSCRSGRA